MLIKFFGLRRSGNHAVINWILGLEPNMLFFNQVELYADPIATHSYDIVRIRRFCKKLLYLFKVYC